MNRRREIALAPLSSPAAMDELPPALVLDILSRLTDSADLARCRVACKTMNSLAREVHAVNLICTLSRYVKSRSPPGSGTLTTPFKTIFRSLIAASRNLRSVSVGVERSLGTMPFDELEADESDDLFLTDVKFVQEWLPRVRVDLEVLSISDFWIQSCWRRSDVLALISSNCSSLVELELKNAWLSVDGLRQMPNLRSLTLEFIRLDDEDLGKVNVCFPFLQVLNLIGVGGLREPKIRLLHLKTCQWTVSNAPISLAISAPNLLELKLKCIKPKSLILETPKLIDFHLSLEEANGFSFTKFQDLKHLELVSPDIYKLICMFHSGDTVKKLAVDSVKSVESSERTELGLESLLGVFPNIVSLNLGPRSWSKLETHFQKGGLERRKRMDHLKEITARIQTQDADATVLFIGSMLEKCTGLTDMRLLIHCDTDPSISSNVISVCTMRHPGVRWRWGMWEEGGKDIWVSYAV